MKDYIIEKEGNFCLVQETQQRFLKVCSKNCHFVNTQTNENVGSLIDLTNLEQGKNNYKVVSNANDSDF